MRLLVPAALLLLLTACAPEQEATTPPAATTPADSARAAPETVKPAAQADVDALRARLAKTLPGIAIDAIRATPIAGLYEIQARMQFAYTSLDGRYLLDGDLSDLAAGQRLTENSRRIVRLERLNALGTDQVIEYAPAKLPAKYTVTVFTDIDCGYCRELHKHIAEYNADGIAVRYAFFPRSGADTPSFHKAEKVWCAADRKSALTQAKLGAGYEGDMSCKNPVLDHLKLATELGLRGTPAIVLPDGELVPGYQTPAQLLQTLAKIAPVPAAG